MTKVRVSYVVAMLAALAGFATPATAQDARPQTAQAPAAGVLGSAQYSSDPDLQCDLLEVKRISGGALMIRWRLVNGGRANTAGGGFANTAPAKTIYYNFEWPQLFYIDPAENKKYLPLTDSANARILEIFIGDLPASGQRLNWAKFPAPPPGSTKISVSIPNFAPFEDVPVAQ